MQDLGNVSLITFIRDPDFLKGCDIIIRIIWIAIKSCTYTTSMFIGAWASYWRYDACLWNQKKHYHTESREKARASLQNTFGIVPQNLYITAEILRICSSKAFAYINYIPTWISNPVPSKVWDEITCPCTGEVSEWISNVFPYIAMMSLLIHIRIKVEPF